jgi:dTDP-glucose 4,6-dehydratase
MTGTRKGRLLITGGAGFLGSHLCERLLADGWKVWCADNLSTGSYENIEHLENESGFCFLHADVTAALDFPGPLDAVLHFASPASPKDYLQLPIETLAVGSLGTFNALELARTKRARFMLASTSETYGDPAVHPQPESYWGHVNPVGPRSVYDEAKRFAEAATMAYRRYHGVDTTIVRIFNTYGPRMRPHDGRAVPTFILQALAGEPITVAGDGKQTRSVCYVDDLVDGILLLLDSSHAGPLNVGSSDELPVLVLAEMIRDLCQSESPISFMALPEDDPCVRQPDLSLARNVLGWSPSVDVFDGLGRTIEWFRGRQGPSLASDHAKPPIGAR